MEEPKIQGINPQNEDKNGQKKGKIPFLFGQKQEKTSSEEEKSQKTINEQPPANAEKVKELTEALQRLQAEFENFQKRSTKQNEEFKAFANAKVIEEILPVLDSLEQGMLHNKEFGHIHEQLFSILKKRGVQKIHAAKGMKFDHDTMECLLTENDPHLKDDAVSKILSEGYLLNGKVLRPVKVSVNALTKEKKECEAKSEGPAEKKENEKQGKNEKEIGDEKR